MVGQVIILRFISARYSGAGGGSGGDGDVQSTGVVISAINSGNAPNQPQVTAGNASNANQNGGGNAGGAWGDDIDFDLNNDLSSNGYMK